MSQLQVVATGDPGEGALADRGVLLIDYVQSHPCGLGSVEVSAQVFDDEARCQEESGWTRAHESWAFESGRGRLYELEMANVGVDQWWVAWRAEPYISNERLVEDLRRLFHPHPAMRIVWIEGVKTELAAEAAAHETSLLKRMGKSIKDVIVLDCGDDDSPEVVSQDSALGSWRPSGDNNSLIAYFCEVPRVAVKTGE
jgi:hypothetical protein